MENKIIRTTTGLIITPYRKKQNMIIEKLTSIQHFSSNRRFKREEYTGYYIKPKMFASRLFDLDFLISAFPNYNIEDSKPYIENYAKTFSFDENIEFTDIQLSFIDQMMNLRNNRIFCNLQTGFGKTFIMLYIIAQVRRKSFIFCYSSTVLNQWKKSLKNHTNFDMKRLLYIDKSSMIKDILEDRLDVSEIDIFLCTHSLISSYTTKYTWYDIDSMFRKLGIGVKVFDEAHRNIKSMTLIDAFTNVRRTYYLSADYSQSNNDKSKQFFSYFFNVPIIQLSKDIDMKSRYISAMVVNFNSNPTDIEKMQVIRPSYGFSNFEYMKYQFSKMSILKILKNILFMVVQNNEDGKKILIVTSMIEHVNIIYDYVKDLYPSYKASRFYSELSEAEKEFAKHESSLIIATHASFGPGVDVKSIQYVISMDQFDYITDNQIAGRARPSKLMQNAYYIMLNDIGFDYCVNKIKKRINYLTSRKVNKVKYINIPNEKMR